MSLTISTAVKPEQKQSYVEIAEYTTVYNAMTVKPSQQDRERQNEFVKTLVNLGVWSKAKLIDNFAAHTSQASLLNWKAPGTTNPTAFNAPTFTAYKGFMGASSGSKMVRTNFTPSTHGSGFLGQDDITLIAAVSDDIATPETYATFGSNSQTNGIYATGNYNGWCYVRCNSSVATNNYSSRTRRYFTIARNNSANFEFYKDKVKKTIIAVSSGLCNSELWACGTAGYGASNSTTSMLLVFKYLTQTEINGVIEAIDRYLNYYGNKIRDYQTTINFNVLIDGHSFLSVDRMDDPLIAKVNTVSYYNGSVPGSTVASLNSRASTLDAAMVTETTFLKNLLVIYSGVNDVNNTSGTGTTAYNTLKTYIQARITAGHTRIFVYTMTKTTASSYDSRFEAERVIFNNLLRTDLALLSGVYILDTDTISEMQNPSDTAYYSDLLHPTWKGSKLLGALFSNKVAQLFPI